MRRVLTRRAIILVNSFGSLFSGQLAFLGWECAVGAKREVLVARWSCCFSVRAFLRTSHSFFLNRTTIFNVRSYAGVGCNGGKFLNSGALNLVGIEDEQVIAKENGERENCLCKHHAEGRINEDSKDLETGSTSSGSGQVVEAKQDFSSFTGNEEPNLDDLDRSIPQVDCEFIAALVRCRSFQRSQFLQERAKLKESVASLSEKIAPSVAETSRFAKLGGFGSWRSKFRKGFSSQVVSADDVVNTLSSEDAVMVAPELLTRLSSPERDLLDSTRPEYDDGFLLLDCRTVNEITSWGLIEGAKVLPAHEVFSAFHLPPDEFLEAFGFLKPDPTHIIICYCQYGPRSLMAAQLLSWLGYLKVLHFRDGYYEWGKQYNLLLRRWMEHDKKSRNELRRMATFRAALEMQREIAPEFDKLAIEEAAGYRLDTSRSPGKLRIGDGLRAEAYSLLNTLTNSFPQIEEHTGEQHLPKFLSQATGIDPEVELPSSTPLNINDAQVAALQHSTTEHVDPFSSK